MPKFTSQSRKCGLRSFDRTARLIETYIICKLRPYDSRWLMISSLKCMHFWCNAQRSDLPVFRPVFAPWHEIANGTSQGLTVQYFTLNYSRCFLIIKKKLYLAILFWPKYITFSKLCPCNFASKNTLCLPWSALFQYFCNNKCCN